MRMETSSPARRGLGRRADPGAWDGAGGCRSPQGHAANYSGAEGTLVASVYCREGDALDKKKKSVTLSPPFNDVAAEEAVAKCPKGTRVVSGGFDLGGTEGQLLASRKRGGRKWLASASVGFPLTKKLTAFAYCEQK